MMCSKPVESLKGIGEKTAALFARLGIHTQDELLHFYPRSYESYDEPLPAADLCENSVCAVTGQLIKAPSVRRYKNIQIVTTTLRDLSGTVQLTWYRMPYLAKALPAGRVLTARGRVVKRGKSYVLEQPAIYDADEYAAMAGTLSPIYSQTKGLGNKTIIRGVKEALKERPLTTEYLPEDIRTRNELAECNFAIEHIHFPANAKDLYAARKRLVFDEFFFFLLSIRRLKENNRDNPSPFLIRPSSETDRLVGELPYELTAAQKKVRAEVSADMQSGSVMNRLIQGDVGSGKTMIAVMALLDTACSGYQGAFMVPTEVLARQHYTTITRLFAEHGIDKKVVLVTGSLSAKEKKDLYAQIEAHEADIIVGTHALIQDKVKFDDLALVITDEQHRFGVSQREALGAKGERPHVLVMSATPIPRTLAIIIYGDLDISVIDEMPKNRLPVKNCVVDAGYRPKAWKFIADQVRAGHQAIVICPMVEENELIEAENVTDYTKLLRRNLPEDIRIDSLTGRMKAKDKDKVMERFVNGGTDVLVSTTVVEVGVDVPNATVMMIENAERFGLAQLHQLRGRVGRGEAQSYCIMINTSKDSAAAERLDILNRSNDGFEIASADLKMRGPGDFFGFRQSGDMEFKLADIFTDAALLKTASEEADRLLRDDPELKDEKNGALAAMLHNVMDTQSGSVSL